VDQQVHLPLDVLHWGVAKAGNVGRQPQPWRSGPACHGACLSSSSRLLMTAASRRP